MARPGRPWPCPCSPTAPPKWGWRPSSPTPLINAFAQTRAVKVVPGDRDAECVLEGKVRSLDNTSVAYNSVTQVHGAPGDLEGRIDPAPKKKGDKVLWKDTEILQEDYVVDPNYHAGEATRSEGIRRAAVTLARQVLDKVLLVI